MKKVAIMQPYFFPYIGYFQLMDAVDEFVVYDAIEYTKKGWINRNRILVDGSEAYITVPLMRASDTLFVNQRHLADSWPAERRKMLNRVAAAYQKAPEFHAIFPRVQQWLNRPERNLFNFLYGLIVGLREFLGIETRIRISSEIEFDNDLKAQEKVIAIVNALGGTDYVNPRGGRGLYSQERFLESGIRLNFLESEDIAYDQFGGTFVPRLSIIDVLMFNPVSRVRAYLDLRSLAD